MCQQWEQPKWKKLIIINKIFRHTSWKIHWCKVFKIDETKLMWIMSKDQLNLTHFLTLTENEHGVKKITFKKSLKL